MNTTLEKVKVALLAVIATSSVGIAFMIASHDSSSHDHAALAANTPVSNMVAEPVANKAPITDQGENPVADVNAPKTKIAFKETEHDFGKISQDSENKKVFSFTNTGTEPLVIQNAVGSCGCTVPTYSKEPIAPGKTGTIEVVYKPGSQKGAQTKTVTVTANTEPVTTVLYIKADVQEKK
ncbi:MAG TPA: DUF1573 domain-containing protein [Luteibaculaceae bacterium]|nr:DUF1573 domain-containing protein [Luteibaculaceae bacterium]